jgi:Ala-tRNA(Pro) deacylase
MAIAASIGDFLKRERTPYWTITHPVAYTAQEEAAVAHVPGRRWAKTVVCLADNQPIQVVVPTDMRVDLDRLRELTRARVVRLGTEDEVARLYPECERGAMPPFGALYGQRVYVDATLVGEPEIVFNAGTHADAIGMDYNDFAEIVNPVVGALARPLHR